MEVKINKLRIRTIIGTYDHERGEKQDILFNIAFRYDGSKAGKHDNLEYAVNYKAIVDEIIAEVENSSFYLLEKLTYYVLEKIYAHEQIDYAEVELFKPDAIRFAETISIKLTSDQL